MTLLITDEQGGIFLPQDLCRVYQNIRPRSNGYHAKIEHISTFKPQNTVNRRGGKLNRDTCVRGCKTFEKSPKKGVNIRKRNCDAKSRNFRNAL